jgi:hypothetical protein
MKRDRFVFFLPNEDYYKIPYYGLENEKNVEIIDALIDSNNKLKRAAYLFCSSTKVNRIMKIPGKKLWFPSFCRIQATDDRIFFVFFDAQLRKYTKDYRIFLKKRYKNCRIILFLTDLVASFRKIDLDEIRFFADLILTYELRDAKKYEFQYYPDVYSKLPSTCLKSEYPDISLLFCGYKKNREDMIRHMVDFLERETICSEFIVPDLDIQPQRAWVRLWSNRIPYIEYLKKLQKTNCILELEQEGATGYTLRTLEALCYGRKLITNNKEIKNASFYNESFIKIIDRAEDLDVEWIKREEEVSLGDIGEFTPGRLIAFIQEYFDKRDRGL